jgi:hypothetical protein
MYGVMLCSCRMCPAMSVHPIAPCQASSVKPSDAPPEHNLFDPDKTRLAFGYSTPDGWYVDVIAPATGERIAQLRPDSPAMQGILTLNEAGVVPIIQRVTANQVAFTLQKAGAYAPPDVTFVWDTQTDLVNPSLLYVAPYSETFCTHRRSPHVFARCSST